MTCNSTATHCLSSVIFLATLELLKCEKGNSHKMKNHHPYYKHLVKIKGRTHAAFAGAVVAAAHGMSCSIFGTLSNTGK